MDSAKFSQALLQYRNAPDRDTCLSSASALFGYTLRDFIPRRPDALIGTMWREIAGEGSDAQGRWHINNGQWVLRSSILCWLGRT